MDPLTIALISAGIGAGAGILKSKLVDEPKYDKYKGDRLMLAAAAAPTSAWTGINPVSLLPDTSQEPSAIESATEMGGLGLSQGLNIAAATKGAPTDAGSSKEIQSSLQEPQAPNFFNPGPNGDFARPMEKYARSGWIKPASHMG